MASIREIARRSVGLAPEATTLVERSDCCNTGRTPGGFTPIITPMSQSAGNPTPRLRSVVRASMGLGSQENGEQVIANPEGGLTIGDEEESTLQSCLDECEQAYKTASTVAERRINRAMSTAFKSRLQLIRRARSSGVLVTRTKLSWNRRNPRGPRVQRFNVYGKFSTDGGRSWQIGESIRSIAMRTTGGGFRRQK